MFFSELDMCNENVFINNQLIYDISLSGCQLYVITSLTNERILKRVQIVRNNNLLAFIFSVNKKTV